MPPPAAARMPAIAFAIPFYSNRPYLERAIRSVLAQTTDDWSLIVSDDAGPEGDLSDWIRQFSEADRIRYVRQPRNLGIGGNWNACLRLADAELVTLLHADDELEPDYARLMIDAAVRHPAADVLFCDAQIIDERSRPRFSFPDWIKQWYRPVRGREFLVEGQAGLRSVMRGNFIMCPTMCYRRGTLADDPFDVRWKQVLDLDFIARSLLAGWRFVGLPEKAYRYRRHGANQTQIQSETLVRFEEERDLFREIAAAARARGWTQAADVAERMTIIRLNLTFRLLADLGRGRVDRARSKWSMLRRLE